MTEKFLDNSEFKKEIMDFIHFYISRLYTEQNKFIDF